MLLSELRSVLFQPLFGDPLMKMPLPVSARIMPYFFRAARITWLCGGKPDVSKLDFRRRRVAMGGALVLVLEEAQCEAGATKACRVVGTVKRRAWLMAPAATSS
jgi:hypothetical protein